MKIESTYIVRYVGKLQVLYVTDAGEYFVSSNGGFGQRDTYLEQITEKEAADLLNTTP